MATLEIRCPFCGFIVQAVTPPLVMVGMALHWAENVADTVVHDWGKVGSTTLHINYPPQTRDVDANPPALWGGYE